MLPAQLALLLSLFIVFGSPIMGLSASQAASPSAKPPDDLVTRWYEGAKRETKFVIYSVLRQGDWDKIMNRFRKRYPGVEMELVRLGGESMLQRTLTEYRAGRFLVDLTDGEFHFLLEPGMVAAVKLPAEEGLPVEKISKDGRWHWSRTYYSSIVYNTKLVPSDPPVTFDDLTKPRWKNNLFIVRGNAECWTSLLLGKFDGKLDRLESYLKALAANNPSVQDSHGQTLPLLIGGERAVVGNLHNQIAGIAQAKGSPVAIPTVEATKDPVPLLIMSRAPHPNAARLFANYLQTREAQEGVAEAGRDPSRTDVPSPWPTVPKRIYFFDPERGLPLLQRVDDMVERILEQR